MTGTIESALTEQRWVRSKSGIVAGVCDGLGRRFNIDPWIVRALWLAAALVFGTGVLLYLILWATLPREDQLAEAKNKRLLGVCARMSRASGVDIGAVRALTVILAFASFGATIIGYVVLHFVMPDVAVTQKHLTAAPATITVR
jgi:phage shock protein C